jgi:hypothetical protein
MPSYSSSANDRLMIIWLSKRIWCVPSFIYMSVYIDQDKITQNYLGIGDTFTPMHKDLCASSGHNLMCYTENGGSAFWFLTASEAAPAVAKYFHDIQHELDQENYIITLEDLINAPFDIYITQQQLGDLVLIPPRSCHQVVNYGGLTIKSSWSRVTIKGRPILPHNFILYQTSCRARDCVVPRAAHISTVCPSYSLHIP